MSIVGHKTESISSSQPWNRGTSAPTKRAIPSRAFAVVPLIFPRFLYSWTVQELVIVDEA
jgi:hypothetical protein